jgi:hypothetical protein
MLLLAALVVACQPATPPTQPAVPAPIVPAIAPAPDQPSGPITLTFADKKIALRFRQHGKPVPTLGGSLVMLQAAPFDLLLDGDVSALSFLVLTKVDLLNKLPPSDHTLLLTGGSGAAWGGNEFLIQPNLVVLPVNEGNLAREWTTPKEAPELAAKLHNAFPGTLHFTFTGRQYIYDNAKEIHFTETYEDRKTLAISAGPRTLYIVFFLQGPTAHYFSPATYLPVRIILRK